MTNFIETRQRRLRDGINFGADRCMEIGALVHPIIKRDDGNVFYADHLSTEDLKKQFSWDPNFQFDQLVNVDFVWDNKRPLKDCVSGAFDYVVASHVGEHVPNLIEWINQIGSILRPSGQVRLVLPDGRYSFDMKRQPTRLSDLLAAWIKKSYCPETHLVLDFALNKVDDKLVEEMHRRYVKDFDASDLPSQFPFHEVLQWGERTLDPTHYEDVHCWALHLNLFAKFMMILAKNDIVQMACVQYYDIDPPHTHEFMVFMSPEEDKEKRVASWTKVYLDTLQTKAALNTSSQPELEQLRQDNIQLKEDLQAIHASSSWRITSPLRAMMKYFKK